MRDNSRHSRPLGIARCCSECQMHRAGAVRVACGSASDEQTDRQTGSSDRLPVLFFCLVFLLACLSVCVSVCICVSVRLSVCLVYLLPTYCTSDCLSLHPCPPLHAWLPLCNVDRGYSRKDLTVGLAHKRGGKGGMYQLIIGNKGNLQVDLEKIKVRRRRRNAPAPPTGNRYTAHRPETAEYEGRGTQIFTRAPPHFRGFAFSFEELSTYAPSPTQPTADETFCFVFLFLVFVFLTPFVYYRRPSFSCSRAPSLVIVQF